MPPAGATGTPPSNARSSPSAAPPGPGSHTLRPQRRSDSGHLGPAPGAPPHTPESSAPALARSPKPAPGSQRPAPAPPHSPRLVPLAALPFLCAPLRVPRSLKGNSYRRPRVPQRVPGAQGGRGLQGPPPPGDCLRGLIKHLFDLRPCGSDGKASAYNAGDLGSVLLSGRSPGEGNDNPLQYSCLENPVEPRSLAGYSPWGPRVGHDCATSLTHSLTHSSIHPYHLSLCRSTIFYEKPNCFRARHQIREF